MLALRECKVLAHFRYHAERERLALQNKKLERKTHQLADLELLRPHRLERKHEAYQAMVIACVYIYIMSVRILTIISASVSQKSVP